MRNAPILLLYCFLCYPRLLAQHSASIEGTVVNSATGAPLSRVHLKLVPRDPDEEAAPVYGAVSNWRTGPAISRSVAPDSGLGVMAGSADAAATALAAVLRCY